MNKPCDLCPCKPTTPEIHRGILRSVMAEIKNSDGFPCHHLHPEAHALTEAAVGLDGKFYITDCAGYKLWGLNDGLN